MAPAKQRIEYLDLAKGIGIVLVVWAHANGPLYLYIYQFHMPFFFLISGILYSPKASVKEFIRRKVHSLYLPFVFWNLVFFLCTCLVSWDSVGWPTAGKHVGLILLTLSKDGQFGGATWFLGALFLVECFYRIIEEELPPTPANDVLKLGLFAAVAAIGFQITLPQKFSRTMILSLFFAAGVFMKRYEGRLRAQDSWLFGLLFLALFAVIGKNNSANMGTNTYSSPLLFVIGALCASCVILFLCRRLASVRHPAVRPAKRLLILLGQKSMDIVLWQFVFFRIGIVMQMYLHGEEITLSRVLSYYPFYSTDNGWWLAYTLIGLFLPVLWGAVLRFGPWGKLLKKLSVV